MPTNIPMIHKINLEAATHRAQYIVDCYQAPNQSNMDDLLQCADLVGRIESLDTSGRYADLVGNLRAIIDDLRSEYRRF